MTGILLKGTAVIDKLERRFGRFAIPNITLILIMGQVAAFAAIHLNPELRLKIALIPRAVLNGELQRLVTFVFMPPETALIWAFFFWYVFYLMGTALEHHWGTFRYNVFLLIGYVATVAISLITPDATVSNHFVQGTVFLAFAHLHPNFELRLFFILPIQIRWLAMFAWIGYTAGFIFGDWSFRLQIAASVLNFFVFFGRETVQRITSGRNLMARQAQRFAARRKEPDYFHVCAVCGITDTVAPNMDFRYCSQCIGDRAYCSDHLSDHQHAQDEPE